MSLSTYCVPALGLGKCLELESALELGKPSLFANVLYLSKKDGTFNLYKRKS